MGRWFVIVEHAIVDTTLLRPLPPVIDSTAGDFATFGPVHLDVTDGQRSLGFWQGLVGLERLPSSGRELPLGVDGRALVVLHPGASGPLPRAYSGLYHLALHLPTVEAFAEAVARLDVANYPHYPTDHLTHLADYADDPDGNGLEWAFETPQRVRTMRMGPSGPELVDAEGRRRSGRDPIDLRWLFSHLGDDVPTVAPAGTIVGHLHVRVADLDRSVAYYRDAIGFTTNLHMSEFGMSDLSAGGGFPHRLAANVWESAGRLQRPTGTAGLRLMTVVLPDAPALVAAITRVEAAGSPLKHLPDGAIVTDPSGNRILLTAIDA